MIGMTETTNLPPSYRWPSENGGSGTTLIEPDRQDPPHADTVETDPWLPPTPPHGEDRAAPTRPDRPRRGVALLLAVALSAGLVGGGAGAALTSALDDDSPTVVNSLDQRATGTETSNAADGSVEAVAAAVLPSVVSISVRTATGGGSGTGIVLSSDGLILTNNHVVAATAQGADLSVTRNDGTTSAATVVGRDPATDLAVIRVSGASGLTPATLGSSESLRPGQEVVAIGSPLGLEGTVTSGIVSALDRPVRTGGEDPTSGDRATVLDAIQTDAAINPGNSGGPLVNMDGQVIGINSAIATLSGGSGQSGSIGLGFAIPISQARAIADQLVKTGSATHPQLAVSVGDLSSGQVSGDVTGGASLASVQPDGPAADAGLQAGDVITKVDDRAIDSADALIAAVRSHRPGDKATLTYLRDGETRTATVTLGSD